MNSLPKQAVSVDGEATQVRWWLLILIAVAIPVVIFGGWEVMERRFLTSRVDMSTLHFLHLVRGITTALLLAGLVAWYLLREKFPVFPSRESTGDLPRLIDRNERLQRHLKWFVQMRWLASGVVIALILIAMPVTGILPLEALPLLLGWWGLLVLSNIVFHAWSRRGGFQERQIMVQAVSDVVILTGLLNASGGIENPLYIAYLFHVIIPGILLPRRKAVVVTVAVGALFCLLALGEYSNVLPHYTNVLFPHDQAHADAGGTAHGHDDGAAIIHASHDLVYVAGRSLPFLLMLVFTSYFTTVVADRLRRSERELESAARTALLEHERLQSVVHAAGVGMMLLTPEARLVWFSQRSGQWLGLDDSNISRSCPLDSAEGGCTRCIVAEAVKKGRPQEAERGVAASGGATRHFRHSASPICDDSGRIVQVVELVEEITTRKALEAEALHAGKMSVLGQMAAGIAHEIGNPLSSLTTRLHRMRRSGDPEFIQESLDVLRSQMGRIERIVRGVSHFARRGTAGWSRWEINAVVEESLGVLQLDRRARGVTIERDLASPSPWARGVRDQIAQVVLNLLLNAIEAMPSGGTLTVGTGTTNGMVRISITDTGSGIEESAMERLFEPFFSTKPEGTGLGLSISYSLVHAHGGRIEVQSRPGEGSRFVIVLPAPEAQNPPRSNPEATL